jgi:CheY-like chemotaxis protein
MKRVKQFLKFPSQMLPKSIISIDDDPICILVTRKLLEKKQVINEKVEFKSFTSPVKGLSFLKEKQTGKGAIILLLDINMPEMSGFDVLNELSKNQIKDMHIFLLTSSISGVHRKMANEYDFIKGFFNKPLDEEAIETLRSYL